MIPKGTILIIGGAEDKDGEPTPEIAGKNSNFQHSEILKDLLPSNASRGRIEVITTATGHPEDVKATYRKALTSIGYKNIGFMHISTKEQARDPKFVARINKSRAVFFSGGDQLRLSTTIGGTPVVDAITDRYFHDHNFVVAGTSSGAMVMSRTMICGGGVEEALIDTDMRLAAGFGLIDNCIIDTHFIKRGRFGRLAHAVMINPGQLGIGLGEDTALIIRKGSHAECRGSGMVVIIDGSEIGQTNIADAPVGCPVFVENLKVHLLVSHCKFSISERKLEIPANINAKEC